MHEVPVKVAVPGDVDANDSALDGQMGEVASGQPHNVSEEEDRTVTLVRNVRL